MLCGKLLKGGNPELKVVDVFAVKLGKSDKFCNITHYLRTWPSLKKLMLGLSRSVPFGADIIPHEFEMLGEDKTFLEAQGQKVGHAYLKLTCHVFQRFG